MKSDSLSLRGRAFRVCAGGSSTVGSKVGPVGLRTKLLRRDGFVDCVVGEGGEVEVAGVFVPDGSAESPRVVAGVEGGGNGPAGESVRDDQGRCRSCGLAR